MVYERQIPMAHMCEWCGGALPEGRNSTRRFCGSRCSDAKKAPERKERREARKRKRAEIDYGNLPLASLGDVNPKNWPVS